MAKKERSFKLYKVPIKVAFATRTRFFLKPGGAYYTWPLSQVPRIEGGKLVSTALIDGTGRAYDINLSGSCWVMGSRLKAMWGEWDERGKAYWDSIEKPINYEN